MAPTQLSASLALVVMLPTLHAVAGEVNQGQMLPDLSYEAWLSSQQVKPLQYQDAAQLPPSGDAPMRNQNLLAYPALQLRGAQVPYAPGMSGPQYTEQQAIGQNFALLERDQLSAEEAISMLQTQLKEERIREAQLVAQREDEMHRMNESFAHVLSLAEAGAEQERGLEEQLANATAKNRALEADVAKEKEKELEKDTEVMKLREVAMQAEQHVKQSEFLKKRTVKVMHDVQVAQEKVQRTEEIIRHLMPRLEPLLKAAGASQSRQEARRL